MKERRDRGLGHAVGHKQTERLPLRRPVTDRRRNVRPPRGRTQVGVGTDVGLVITADAGAGRILALAVFEGKPLPIELPVPGIGHRYKFVRSRHSPANTPPSTILPSYP